MPSTLRLRRFFHPNKEWGVFLAVTILLPFLFTYLHLYHVLHLQDCVLYKGSAITHEQRLNYGTTLNAADLASAGIYCQRNSQRFSLLSADKDFHGVLPSIATLATRIETAKLDRASLILKEADKSTILWDYSNPVWASLTSRITHMFSMPSLDATLSAGKEPAALMTTNDSSPINKYGFRSNSNNSNTRRLRRYIPVTTYFWMALNIALYLLYWQRQAPVSSVALNSQLLLGDLGRALTGNLAHFEIWHLGVNMMSTSALGGDMALERSLGTIPLFLLTWSWIPLATMVVVALQLIKTKFISREGVSSSTSSSVASSMVSCFPNMVGFSGILFAWMVVATLQTQQKSCPVFFMPDLCFDVYQIGGFTVSLGPLVQLLVLQVILPRASFVGHLAGIVVGFLFHWKMQPPLEWSQPCLLFPLVWFIGKWACLKYFEPIHTDTSSSNSGGRMLGTGQAGTGAVVPWRTNAIQASHTSHEEDRSAALWSLNALRFAVTVHTVVLLGAAFWKNPINSIIISEVILAAFLTFIARASRSTTAATELLGQKFTIGMLGKAFVVTVLVQCITDSMTLAGWTVAGCSAFGGWTILSLWMIRLFLLIVSLCIVCQLLNLTGELPQQGPNSTWSHVLGWWVVKPCSMAGKWLAENLGNRYAGRRINSDDDSQIHTRENTSNNQVLRGRVVSEVV